eukprot:6581730-Karenia_brevis.AAC.1
MNLTRSGDLRFYLDPLRQAEYLSTVSTHASNYTGQDKDFEDILSEFSELDLGVNTHFSSEGLFENRIDRAFWTLPPWAVRLLNVVRPVFPPPQHMHKEDLSDHSPIAICVSSQPPTSPGTRPIPSYVTKHPFYRMILQQYETIYNINPGSLNILIQENPFKAIAYYVRVMRLAATATRKMLLRLPGNFSTDSILTTVSRAYAHQDVSIARPLLQMYPSTAKYIAIAGSHQAAS